MEGGGRNQEMDKRSEEDGGQEKGREDIPISSEGQTEGSRAADEAALTARIAASVMESVKGMVAQMFTEQRSTDEQQGNKDNERMREAEETRRSCEPKEPGENICAHKRRRMSDIASIEEVERRSPEQLGKEG